ncbi:hypothetical protein mRhiFer1_008648 [Rhinolophus ferrumequinum]|uniref:Uncharacterized protein n=1 Tax=Rhinolophus ferrumequinum TaxID=59479 RepID=A0A7J7U0W6_RHIFE|nr:hypothetical protein mRhiFer1_008648 [Rhinolophus ferrumequinum]
MEGPWGCRGYPRKIASPNQRSQHGLPGRSRDPFLSSEIRQGESSVNPPRGRDSSMTLPSRKQIQKKRPPVPQLPIEILWGSCLSREKQGRQLEIDIGSLHYRPKDLPSLSKTSPFYCKYLPL